MSIPRFATVQLGDTLPELVLAPVDRATLALFAGASGDHNPIHIDLDFARRAGLPDVFAHGMLGMAWLGRLVTGWVPQSHLRRLEVRFSGITQVSHAITCRGKVVQKSEQGEEHCVRIEVRAANQYGEEKIIGEALIALP